MLQYIIFLYTLFNTKQNINDFLNPFDKFYNLTEEYTNHVSYKFNIDKNMDNKFIKHEYFEQDFEISGKYDSLIFFGNYINLRDDFQITGNYYKLKKYNEYKYLNLRSGIRKFNVTIIPVLEFNLNLNKLDLGYFISYDKSQNNIKYKISFMSLSKRENNSFKIKYREDNYNFPQKHVIDKKEIHFNLKTENLDLEILNTSDEIKTDIQKKTGFTTTQTGKTYTLLLKTTFKTENFNISFNYFGKYITQEAKNEFDDVKYALFKLKKFTDTFYDSYLILNKYNELKLGVSYQNITTDFYGNIESWPFNDDELQTWAGGRLNIFSKASLQRFLIRSSLKFKIQKLILLPEVFYDNIKITPDSKTYEAGVFGLGKQNQITYTENQYKQYLHFSLKLIYTYGQKYKILLFARQIVPLNSSSKKSDFNMGNFQKTTLQGLKFKLALSYSF